MLSCVLLHVHGATNRQLMSQPSEAISSELGSKIVAAMGKPGATAVAAQLEARYGRARWRQILFPEGLSFYCSGQGLKLGAAAQSTACLCSTSTQPPPLLRCAALLFLDLQAAAARTDLSGAVVQGRRLMEAFAASMSASQGQVMMQSYSNMSGAAARQLLLTDEMAGWAGEFFQMVRSLSAT